MLSTETNDYGFAAIKLPPRKAKSLMSEDSSKTDAEAVKCASLKSVAQEGKSMGFPVLSQDSCSMSYISLDDSLLMSLFDNEFNGSPAAPTA
jgi:hypothetical protein